MLAASVLVAISSAEIVLCLREEICSELRIEKVNFRSRHLLSLHLLSECYQHEFEQVSAWFDGVGENFV
jgi:hypothetical protein